MKYAVIQCSNGSFSVVSEWGDNRQGAIMACHNACRSLWNAPDVVSATVKVVDSNLNTVENYEEHITHAQPEPEEPTDDDDAENEPA